jgi:type IV secretion system protein VirD4
MKTGAYSAMASLELFLDWGITFVEPYILLEQSVRKVRYCVKVSIESMILKNYS